MRQVEPNQPIDTAPNLTKAMSFFKWSNHYQEVGNEALSTLMSDKFTSFTQDNLPLMIVEMEKAGLYMECDMSDGRKFLICATDTVAYQLYLQERLPVFSLPELAKIGCKESTLDELYAAKVLFAAKVVDNPTDDDLNSTASSVPSRLHNKAAAIGLARLRNTISRCSACPLSQTRLTTVPGEGCTAPRIVFVGEGPGQVEDETGKPLVGPAGQELNAALAAAKINREDCFLTNIVKCRPPGNRDPLPNEIQACSSYLYEQIKLLNPVLIVTLGSPALSWFFPTKRYSITKVHGKIIVANVQNIQRPVYPILHPAAALRQKAYREMFVQDIMLLPGTLASLLSARVDKTAEGG